MSRKGIIKRHQNVLPGFGLSLGCTLLYVCLVVLLPLIALVIHATEMSWSTFWHAVSTPRVVAAYQLTFSTAAAAAVTNLICGLLVAWVLVRYSFPGKKVIDALVDLPFALPTAVAGITLTTLYAHTGWIGSHLNKLGLKTAYTPLGITIALVFIGLPFVVRSVQPVLEDLDPELEEAAATLGASRWRSFRSIILPRLWPALLTGFTLALARGLGEYGSVVFISGNMPFRTEIVPLLVMTKLEQFDYEGATAIAIVMLAASLIILLTINLVNHWAAHRAGT